MAILSNGKFYGFLCSVKETGRRLANGVKEYVEDFVSGFAGRGWKLWEYVTGKWKLEIDTIVVRETMVIFEMLISKIRAIIGAQAITQGHGKVKSVYISEDGTEYLVELEDKDMSIVAHDFVRCQTFTGDNMKLYHVEVSSVDVETRTLHISISEFDQDEAGNVLNPPVAGDELVQFGNSQNKARQSAIYLHADESGQPAIDVMFNIDSKNWDGKVKVRVGGDIPGTNGLKGFFCENGMIKSVDDKGIVIYEFSPNGAVNIGKGNIVYNPTTEKVTLGSGVTLTWDNLSDETKDNLKGEPGKDGKDGQDGTPGRDGIDGADGVNGTDGVSLVYKGEFSSHPDNPENGWYYRNTTDKKCYVFQDNAWYVMTVDGSDGKNGLDGVNGKDGNDGLDIVWKGDSPTPPANPQKNWVYRDTDNGRVYIYNGTAWQLMVADGNDGIDGTDGAPGGDGKDGMSVFITYHDGEEEPAIPTGDGTTEGWHTDATTSVIWMSQKVSESADTGSWGNPIKIKGDIGEPGQDANILPWVKEWTENGTQIGSEYIISPKMFSGTAETLTDESQLLTGVAIGRDVIEIDGGKRTGLFGIKENKTTFELDALTGDATFKGKVVAGEESGQRIELSPESSNMQIFNNNGDISAVFEGNEYNNISDFFGEVPTIDIVNLPYSLSEHDGILTHHMVALNRSRFLVKGTTSLSFTYYMSFVVASGGSAKISIKVNSFSDLSSTNMISSKQIVEVAKNTPGRMIADHTTPLVVLLDEGYNEIIVSLFCKKSTANLVDFICHPIVGGYVSKYFANGLMLGDSTNNLFYVLKNKNGNLISEIRNSSCGIKQTEEDVYCMRNEVIGFIPGILCSGLASLTPGKAEFRKVKTFNGTPLGIEWISTGVCDIIYPDSWNAYSLSINCYVMLTGVGYAYGTTAPIKATFMHWKSNRLRVLLSDDSTANDGDFFFEVKLW